MNIVIIGHGGHSKVISDLISLNDKYRLIGYLDDKYDELIIKESIYYGPVLSIQTLQKSYEALKCIIGIGNNHIRKTMVQKARLSNDDYATLIHPSAVVSASARIGAGTVIMAHSVINADTKIGAHTIINTGAIVEHDCQIGDFVHLSPSVTLTGSVEVNDGAHIGAAAAVIPQVKVGMWSTIGAGAAVINDLPAYTTAVGVPARITM
jgi:acetyltransferase EpsM